MESNMKQDFRDSNTYKNIRNALQNESQVNTRYEIYAKKAKEEGYQQIGDLFEATARNERAHAEIWMKLLNNGDIGTTEENLRKSYGEENREWTTNYIRYAEEARREGYQEIARIFEGVASVEQHHDARFRKLTQNIKSDTVFCKKNANLWICTNCGHLYYDICASDPCSICGYPQGYAEINSDNY